MRKWAIAALLAAAFVVPAYAGEVVFKNGDRITGEVTELGDGKLKIKSAVAGEIVVSLADVATFSTDKPIEIKLKDGSVVNQQVSKSETAGAIQTAPSASGVPAGQLTLDQVATINEPKAVTKWTGNIRGGAIFARGNSDTDAFNLAAEAVRRTVDDRFSLTGQYLFGRQKDADTGAKTTSTDNWFVQGKYDYFLTKQWYLYGVAKFERDNISNLNLRATPGVGVGYQWFEGPKANFRTEAGVGITYEDFEGQDSETFLSGRLAYAYDRVIVENVKFIHNLEYRPSFEDLGNYIIEADAGVRVKLTDAFFTDFKIEWKHTAEPGPDSSSDDLRYILSFGWVF
jgi:putative salt-induced outer membrane protein YdiY